MTCFRNKHNGFKSIPETVMDTIGTHGLFCSGDSLLVAVSGGADSVALVHMLASIEKGSGLRLGIAHLNHELRGTESDEDQTFVERLAESLGLPFFSERVNVKAYQKTHGLSLEEAARNVRYPFLFETANHHGYDKIATAHHADDNAELFLMNLFRGSGPQGLKAMEATGHDGRVIRPLIGTGRNAILAYIEKNGLTYRTDSSNHDRSFQRNRIRHDLLPLLEKDYQKGVGAIITRTAGIIAEDESFVDEMVEPMFRRAVVDEQENMISLSVSTFSEYPKAAQRRVIRKAMFHVKKNLRRITFLHTEKVVELIHANSDLTSLDFPDRLRVIRKGDLLHFRMEETPLRDTPVDRCETFQPFQFLIDFPGFQGLEQTVPGTPYHFHFSVVERKKLSEITGHGLLTAFVNLDLLNFPLVLRNTQHSDRFRPIGMKGRKKAPLSLKFEHHGTPARFPGSVILSNNEVIWVCGYRISDRFKLEADTEKVLKIELFLD
jgi:tRNA(Ile)-lysidine synthase